MNSTAEPKTLLVREEQSVPAEIEVSSGKASVRHRLLLAAALLGMLSLGGYLTWRYGFRTASPVFQLAAVETGRIDATVAATGSCNAVVDVQVGSQVSGNIKALYADFNTRVKAGQLVAVIDPELFEAKVKQADAAWRNAKAAVESAKAAVVKAESDVYSARASEANQTAAIAKAKVAVVDTRTKLARRHAMFSDRIMSQEDLDTAQAAYDQAVAEQQAAEAQHEAAVHSIQSAEAALIAATKNVGMYQAEVDLAEASLNQSRIDLAHTRITAPVDGTVIARRMDVGQTVAASFQAPTIFEIAQDLTKMQVDTNVAESDIGRVRVGQVATFTVDAYPGQVFQGRVTQIRRAPINVQNVITYDAVLQVANPDLKLFPGMTANVTILTYRSEGARKVPNAALRVKLPASVTDVQAKPARAASAWGLVYVVSPNNPAKALAVPVKLGISDGNFTEVVQGDLPDGQKVIVGVALPGAAPARAASPGVPTRL